MSERSGRRPEALAVQALGWEEPATGAIVPSIHPSTTYARDAGFHGTRTWLGAHGAGARLAVDSTAATPVPTRSIAHGADLVMQSATK